MPTNPTAAATVSTITKVPAEFQGKWVTHQSNCVSNPDTGIVDIEKNRLYGYEWSSDIKSTVLAKQPETLKLAFTRDFLAFHPHFL
ncbi:MAG: hypothetical protein EXR90_03255 [Methyloglobulus sp.]|nr:hypothetical protein [Methyloglobulus sp.]